ncbi:hypothetical protein PHYSODRAFT_469938, partial [Phytophthora sojae]
MQRRLQARVTQWSDFCHERRRRRQQVATANKFYNGYLLCLAMFHWQSLWLKTSALRHKEAHAVRQINSRRLSKAVCQWYENYQHLSSNRLMKVQASRFRSKRLLTRCFRAWKGYNDAVRHKVSKRRFATRLRQRKVLSRMFQRWQKFAELRAFERRQLNLALEHRSRVVRRLVFQNWKSYRSKRTLYIVAYTFRRKLLLQKVWIRWNQHRARITEMGYRRLEYSQAALLRRWYHNVRERVEQRAKVARAIEFQASNLREKTWKAWQMYVACRHEKEKQLVWILGYYSVEVLLRKSLGSWKKLNQKEDAFGRWKTFWQQRQSMNEKRLQARVFHCVHLEQRSLNAWRISVRDRKQSKMARAFNTAKVLRTMCTLWKRKVHVLRQVRRMFLYQENFQAQTHFDAWKRYATTRKQLNDRLRGAMKFRANLVKVDVWQKWKTWVTMQQQERDTILLAVDFRDRFS